MSILKSWKQASEGVTGFGRRFAREFAATRFWSTKECDPAIRKAMRGMAVSGTFLSMGLAGDVAIDTDYGFGLHPLLALPAGVAGGIIGGTVAGYATGFVYAAVRSAARAWRHDGQELAPS